MNNKLYFFLCAWVFFLSFQDMNAQRTISGTVRDAETGGILDAANIVVLDGQRTVGFAFSNTKGAFSIPISVFPDTLMLHVSMMGYIAFSEKIDTRSTFPIALKPTAIQLKEVVIRPGRIWGRSDTLRYDASKFLRDNDKTVEDLMKRLPGIDVDDDGNIKFRGKGIGTMYVEGLDLMGNRYKGISKNLSAVAVKEVEVLDNHQRIKSLAGKVPSDIADINIKLKDDFKDKWNFNPRASLGFSDDDFLYEAEAGAVQIARKSQSLYALKSSNTGNGITKEMQESGTEMQSLPDYRLLSENTVSAPIKEKRWLFDDAVLSSANRLYRVGEDSRIRLNASYSHDDISQQTEATTTYFNPSDTVRIDEQKNSRLKQDKFAFSADFEDNKQTHYLRNKLDVSLAEDKMQTAISGSYDVSQRQTDKSFSMSDNFSFTRTLANKNVLHAKSVVGFWQRHQELLFDENEEPFNLNGFYSRSEAGVIIGKSKIAQRYTAGFSTDFNTLKTNHRTWITPGYEYIFRQMKFNLSTPLQLVYFPSDKKEMFLPEANFRTDYKINYAWNMRFMVRFAKESDNISAFYTRPYYSDYRTINENESGTPLSKRQFYSLRTEYKNTLQEFFVSANLTASRTSENNTFEQRIEDNLFYWTRRYTKHNESAKGIEAMISKGFYGINTKMALETSYWDNRSAQLRNGELQPFSFNTFTLKPTLSFSPTSQTEIAYNSELRRQDYSFDNENSSAALWNMNHKASFYYTQKRFDASLSVEYFRNEIAKDNTVNLVFLNFSATYKLKKMALQLQLTNLLNKTGYSYTAYNPLSVYSSKVNIRPREVLLGVRVAF